MSLSGLCASLELVFLGCEAGTTPLAGSTDANGLSHASIRRDSGMPAISPVVYIEREEDWEGEGHTRQREEKQVLLRGAAGGSGAGGSLLHRVSPPGFPAFGPKTVS